MKKLLIIIGVVAGVLCAAYMAVMGFFIFMVMTFGLGTDYDKCTPKVKAKMEELHRIKIPDSLRWEKFKYEAFQDSSWTGVFTVPEDDLWKMFPKERFTWLPADDAQQWEKALRYLSFQDGLPENPEPPERYQMITEPPEEPHTHLLQVIAEFPEEFPDEPSGRVKVWMAWWR